MSGLASKPYGVCWCDCHMPVDDEGRRKFGDFDPNTVDGWPRYDDPVATESACTKCRRDHDDFIHNGTDRFTNRLPCPTEYPGGPVRHLFIFGERQCQCGQERVPEE